MKHLKTFKIPPKLKDFGVQKFNIIFVGMMGAGKSSTINTLASTFYGKFKQICKVGRDTKSVTTEISKISLFDNEAFNCIDTFGIEFNGTGPKNIENSNYARSL